MIVFIDTETGGLNPIKHELIEVAWAKDDIHHPQRLVLPHRPDRVDPMAAQINGYHTRHLDDPENWDSSIDIAMFGADLIGATLCGANPSFDAAFISSFFSHQNPFGDTPWHYRLLDIESMFVGAFPNAFDVEVDGVPGLRRIVEWINDYDPVSPSLPSTDHTAVGDVVALREVYRWIVLNRGVVPA